MSHERLSKNWEKLKDGIRNWGRPYPNVEPFMPFTLSYAMQYREAGLDNKEINSLITGDYTDLATYSLLKALNEQPDAQQAFLESFVDIVLHDAEDRAKIKELQLGTLQSQVKPDALPIKGGKVAQIFRQGIHLWEHKFSNLAEEIETMDQSTVPVYLGYGATLGLRQGIEAFKNSGRKILTFNQNWAEDPNNNNCGYEIDLKRQPGERVKPLPKDFERPQEYILIDDTRHTGAHIRAAWGFWSNNSGEPIPEFRFRALNIVNPSSKI